MSDEVPDHCRPRHCHIVKWKDFQGYGFNLHAEKGKAGQFVGKIDENSPAEAAGLKEGDRIVEVNNVSIGSENHQQVVARIKAGGDETRLLVADASADDWYKTNKRVIRGDSPEVLFISAKRDIDDHQHAGHGGINGDEHSHSIHVEQNELSVVSASVHNGTTAAEDYSHRPRLCHLKYWPHFEGYGFNLHAEKDKPGQYIGLVDDNSPSSTGGLRVNDRIIEVNGVNVEQEKHTQVIARIKAIHGETKLLVVDKATDIYYQKKGVTISSSMPQAEHFTTPDCTADTLHELKSNASTSSEHKHTSSTASHGHQDSSSSSSRAKDDNFELNLSVAEMKERLKSKKRQDPRMNKVPFEQKYKDFQRM